jgi:hypothetical protein
MGQETHSQNKRVNRRGIRPVVATVILAFVWGAFSPDAVREFVMVVTMGAISAGISLTILFLVLPQWNYQAPTFAKLTGLLILFFLVGMSGYGMRYMWTAEARPGSSAQQSGGESAGPPG